VQQAATSLVATMLLIYRYMYIKCTHTPCASPRLQRAGPSFFANPQDLQLVCDMPLATTYVARALDHPSAHLHPTPPAAAQNAHHNYKLQSLIWHSEFQKSFNDNSQPHHRVNGCRTRQTSKRVHMSHLTRSLALSRLDSLESFSAALSVFFFFFLACFLLVSLDS
jgi:hypothetical protein